MPLPERGPDRKPSLLPPSHPTRHEVQPIPWLTQAHTIHRVVQINLRQVLVRTLVWGIGIALLLAIPFVFYFQAEMQGYKGTRQAEKERVIRLASEIIHQEMEAVLSDLRFMSRNNEMRDFSAGDSSARRKNLAREFLELARQKHLYDQVRFIGMDGMEKVRINFADGRPYIVPDRKLQYKGDRPYFMESSRLDASQIHVSPFDLNFENGQLERPFKPVIRFAIPVADAQGHKLGVVVLNYQGRRLLDRLATVGGEAGSLWLIDPRGYWLLGPGRESTWGFVVPGREKQSLPARYPALWKQLSLSDKGVHSPSQDWVRFERVYPFGHGTESQANYSAKPVAGTDYYWTLTASLPAESLQAGYAGLTQKIGFIYGAWVLFGLFLAGSMSFLSNRNAALAHVMESVIDNLPVLIAYVDSDRRYRFNNMAYERFFGLSPKQLFGKSLREVLGEASYLEVESLVGQALSGQAVTFERRLPYARAGQRDVVISYIPDVSPGARVQGFYVLVNDVTPLKDSERRERQRMLELAHVSRLASLGEMASEIAHEVNQPLAAIAMFSAACLRTIGQDGEKGQVRGWLESINAQAKRASEVVRHLRRFVRKGEIQPGPVDLNQVVREVLGLMRFDASKQSVTIDLELAEGMPSLSAELILVEQVLFNLVRNALEAMAGQIGEKHIVIRTGFDQSSACVEVQDTGPGVDACHGDSIFESFMTDKKGGLGMGLAISRSIVAAHGGTLGYVNNPQGGATFRCCLPREVRHG